MLWTALGKVLGYKLMVFLAGAVLALLVAAPAAHASYNKDHGTVSCRKGKTPALQVKAKGNPVYVRAVNYAGKPVIFDDFRTYAGTTTRIYYASGRYANQYMEWMVFVRSGNSDYVSRQGTFGYCA